MTHGRVPDPLTALLAALEAAEQRAIDNSYAALDAVARAERAEQERDEALNKIARYVQAESDRIAVQQPISYLLGETWQWLRRKQKR